MWLHVANGCFIGIVTVSMVALAYKHYEWAMRDNIHSTIGLIATIASGLVIIGGFMTKLAQTNMKWKTHRILNIKMMH